jgi:pyridoxal 5'-phosphate synthase pdxT subunit
MRAGVLALQGGFTAHAAALGRLGVAACEVRRCAQLPGLDALLLPGGESSALLRLMDGEAWFDALRAFHQRGGALLGTCAGCILLARGVSGPSQPSAGVIDIEVVRNAYGRQVASFETTLHAPGLGGELPGVFIRAPKLRGLGDAVEVLAWHGDEPVLVRQGRVTCATFHPELSDDLRVHQMWIEGAAGMAV